MNEKEKIRKYLDYKGVSKNKFYSITGFSVGFLDSGASIGADKIKTIIMNYPDLSLKWLVLDDGDMIVDGYNNFLKTENYNSSDKDITAEYKKAIDNTQTLINDLISTKEELIKIQKIRIETLEHKIKELENIVSNSEQRQKLK